MTLLEQLYKIVTENDARRSYSCLMLDCAELATAVRKIQDSIDPDDVFGESGFGLENSPHITVLYGIHSNKPDEVWSKIDLTPVNYQISGISLFENDDYDVLKLDIRSKDLHQLNAHCKSNLDYTSSYPNYIPHLTIGYLQKGEGRKYCKKQDIVGRRCYSDTFIFSDQLSQKVWWKV